MNNTELYNAIESRKTELFEHLSKLIQINSENFNTYGNEKECAEYLLDVFKSLGLEAEMYSPMDLDNFAEHPDYMPGKNLENRFNVTARWRGEEDEDYVMLMGHIDTVEIGDVANWEFDPLSGKIEDGKIFGRGACDDKYSLATMIHLITILKENGFKPKKNILFTAFCDEENGGSHGAMAAVMKYPCKKHICLDGRPVVWNCASAGQVVEYVYHCEGTVDSAYTTGRALTVVMDEMDKFAAKRKTELENNPFYNGTNIPATSFRYYELRAGNEGVDMGVGKLQFVFYTDKTKEAIYNEFAEHHKNIDAMLAPLGFKGDGFKPCTRFFHYGECSPESDIIKNLSEASKEVTGEELTVCGSCLSDLSVVIKYGGEAVAFGAGRDFSKKGGAHQPNEFIECDELVKFVKIIGGYIMKTLTESE